MITKTTTNKPLTHEYRCRYSAGQTVPEKETYQSGSSIITYDGGPKYSGFGLNWKSCQQRSTNAIRFVDARFEQRQAGSSYWFTGSPRLDLKDWSVPSSYPLAPNLSEVYQKILDQLDLNCNDSVMLYSGILQAVPLVGGAFKFVSVFNNLAKQLSKDFKRKPFTTVVKSAISLDFIDRFVVKPTIDDARKFINAHNYVVNVMNTAYSRSQPLPTAYSDSIRNIARNDTSRVEQSGRIGQAGFPGVTWYGTRRDFSESELKVFLLAQVAYNTSAIDPIKLWATRLGVNRPLDSVWDLVPFSFVIDYFTRAGDFIAEIGDRVSSQDGLVGKIQRIHSAWYTLSSRRGIRVDWTECKQRSTSNPVTTKFLNPGFQEKVTKEFSRQAFNPLALKPISEDNNLLHIDLTKTRVRTLAQLFIQAKL